MSPDDAAGGTAAGLRRAFDESFRRSVDAAGAAAEDFLAIRLRGDPHVIRQVEVARLLRFRGVVRYPAPAPAWLGLAGVAGSIVPVYDLAVLAGYATAQSPGWMVLCAAMPVALAFDGFDGHFRRADADADAGADADAPSRPGVLRMAGEARPVVSIASLLEIVRSLARPTASGKES
jgi:purine-binding chemotaxis protein CheW